MFTHVVYSYIRSRTGCPFAASNLSGLQQPTLFGDVLILPINGYGNGQSHSGSGDPKHGLEFARHHFMSVWVDHKDWLTLDDSRYIVPSMNVSLLAKKTLVQDVSAEVRLKGSTGLFP